MANRQIEETTLQSEVESLRQRLAEAEETLRAIRVGEVDALVIYGEKEERIYTLQGADHAYKVMVESIHEGAATLQRDSTIIFCNKFLAEMLQVPQEMLLGNPLLKFIPPEDQATFLDFLEQGRHKALRVEFRLQRMHASNMSALLSISPVEMNGETLSTLIVTDLTEQKRNEEILAAERMARSILEQVVQAIVVCDSNGVIIRASTAAVDLVQRNLLLLPFDDVFRIQYPEDLPQQNGEGFSIQNVLAGISYKGLEGQLMVVRKENPAEINHWREVQVNAAPLRNEQGKVLGCIIALIDLTHIREAEIERRSRLAQDEVQHHLLDQREQERQQIARDLHDGPIQDLMGLIFSIQGMMGSTEDPQVNQQLKEIREGAQRLAGTLRGVCNELRPPTLVQFGLAKAIRSHVTEFMHARKDQEAATLYPVKSQDNLPEVHVELMQDECNITAGARLALYRIYQESLNNVLRHSQAQHVTVRLAREDNWLTLEIEDDGKGFEMPGDWLALARAGHLGLVGMKERSEALDGRLEVHSTKGGGTRVRVLVPWKE